MNFSNILIAVGIAFGFAGWAVIGKFSQATGAWLGTIVLTTSVVIVALLSRHELATLPTTKSIIILLVAGVLNGVACYFYAKRAADPKVITGALVVLVSMLMVAWAPILDWCLNGIYPSLRQVVGFVCAAGAIYLLAN